MKNPLNGCSADMMSLVAALGGSGEVSCLWSITWTAIHSGTQVERSAVSRRGVPTPIGEPSY